MCGIAGLIYKKRCETIQSDLDKMLNTIIHRGPDGEGRRIFDNRIALGHRRLAIIDLSDDGLQPMVKKKNYWITFNGEIYNYLELRKELKAGGLNFSTQTDTEVLLASYIYWGEDCVNHFNGMWSFAIYDKTKGKLFCSRDRYGVKPFYYEWASDRFAFASEIKEIVAIKDKDKIKVNRDNFMAYLTNGILDSNEHTMFAGIDQLLGGWNLVLDCDTLEMHKYQWYELGKVELNQNTREKNYTEFRDKFLHAVDLRLRADVSVGSCLSGGLDSSAIVCAVHENLRSQGKEDIQYTVSSCFEDKRYDEQEYIEAVVKHTGVTSYKVFPDMEKLFSILDKMIWHMDEPFGGTSIFAQWNVFETAKKHNLKVMLDGQGADEQLAGYTPFYKVLFLDLLKHGRIKRLKKEIDAYKNLRADSEPIKTWELLASVIMTAFLSDGLRFKLNKLFRRNKGGMPFPEMFYDNAVSKSGWERYDKRDSQKYIDASMHNGMSALLHYEDRDSMAHSIESRVPFLDYELAEFIFSIPLEQKIEEGRTKNILREGLKDLLPPPIYNRYSKLGFVTPEDQWLKDNEEFFYQELEKACDVLHEMIDKKRVLNWYRSHVQETRMGDSTCFRIICAAHWVKVFEVRLSAN